MEVQLVSPVVHAHARMRVHARTHMQTRAWHQVDFLAFPTRQGCCPAPPLS